MKMKMKMMSLFAVSLPLAASALPTMYATPNPTYDESGAEVATQAQTVDGTPVEAWSLKYLTENKTDINVTLLKGMYDYSGAVNPNTAAGSLFTIKSGNGEIPLFSGETGNPDDVVIVGGGLEQNLRCFWMGRKTIFKGITIRNFGLTGNGAAIATSIGSTGAVISRCKFSDNIGKQAGAISAPAGALRIEDSVFERNKFTNTSQSEYGAGAVYGCICVGCQFVGNGCNGDYKTVGSRGGAVYLVKCTNCVFTSNSAYIGGAVGGANGSPSVCYQCAFTNNVTGKYGVVEEADCIKCDFYGNTAVNGETYLLHGVAVHTIENCRFVKNTFVSLVSYAAVIKNSLIACNTAKNISSIRNLLNSVGLVNCVVANNDVDYSTSGAVYVLSYGSGPIQNTVFFGNKRTGGFENQFGILYNTAKASHCVFDMAIADAQTGDDCTILTDKKILPTCYTSDADGVPTGIVRNATSKTLLIDKGCEAGWTADDLDLAGNPRVFNEIVDIGCYEYFKKRMGFILLLR